MKRYFLIALAVVLCLSIGIIIYGTYLNKQGEFQITKYMEENLLTLKGSKVQVREVQPRLTMNTLNLYANDMADAVVLIDGRIDQCLAPKNSYVHKGDVIFVVVNENIRLQIKEAESNLLKAQAQLSHAENNYRRYQRLREQKATSAEKYEEAQLNYQAAVANLEEAQARKGQYLVQQARQEVVAPTEGKVLLLYRQLGSFVQAGTSLALVGDFQNLYFNAPVSDEQLRHVMVGTDMDLEFNQRDFQKIYNTDYESGNKGTVQQFQATVMEITPPLNEPAQLRNVLWRVDNRSGLLEPQTYGGISLQMLSPVRVLSVPLTALKDAAHDTVFVVDDDGVLVERKVVCGADDGKYIEIISGLTEGEIVIDSGTGTLVAGKKVNVEVKGDDALGE